MNITPVLKDNKFDLIIISRHYRSYIREIEELGSCNNVYIQAHDTSIFGDSMDTVKQLKCFKGVATLSKYQEDCLHTRCGVDYNDMVRIGNGIDPDLFKDISITPQTTRLLFSSCYERGGDMVTNDLFPLINDVCEGLDFCSYNNISYRVHNAKYLGQLSKTQLYEEMGKRYFWFYPSTFDETFCITMIENIMAENDLVLPVKHGTTSVIEPFVNDVTMQHSFNNKGTEEYKLALEEAADRIKESIHNHDKGKELRAELKNHVLTNYT